MARIVAPVLTKILIPNVAWSDQRFTCFNLLKSAHPWKIGQFWWKLAQISLWWRKKACGIAQINVLVLTKIKEPILTSADLSVMCLITPKLVLLRKMVYFDKNIGFQRSFRFFLFNALKWYLRRCQTLNLRNFVEEAEAVLNQLMWE